MEHSVLDPGGLYHLATSSDWEQHRAAGRVVPESLSTEGFVHCSWGHQVAGTLERHFAGVAGVVALRLREDRLGAPVVEEDSSGTGQAFPHVYAAIPVEAVAEVVAIPSRPSSEASGPRAGGVHSDVRGTRGP